MLSLTNKLSRYILVSMPARKPANLGVPSPQMQMLHLVLGRFTREKISIFRVFPPARYPAMVTHGLLSSLLDYDSNLMPQTLHPSRIYSNGTISLVIIHPPNIECIRFMHHAPSFWISFSLLVRVTGTRVSIDFLEQV